MTAVVYYCHCPPSQGRDSDAGKWMAQGALNEAEAKEGDKGEHRERGDVCRGALLMGIVFGEEEQAEEEIAVVFLELQKGRKMRRRGGARGSGCVGLAACKISGREDYYCLLSRMGL